MPEWVEIPAPGDLVLDERGHVVPGETVTLKLAGTGTDVVHASNRNGDDQQTLGLITRTDGSIGTLAQRRFMSSGAAADMTIRGISRLLQPLAASVESDIAGKADQADLDAVESDVAENTADVAVVKEAPLHLEDPRYGGVGDGATNNSAALTAAIAALPAAGGEILLGRGAFHTSAFPNLTDKRSAIFLGLGGLTGGAPEATQLIYTGAGAGTFITAQSTFGVHFRDMLIGHSGAFTGTLLDYSQKPAGLDTQFPSLKGVTLAGTPSNRGATGLKLVKAVNGYFEHVNFRDLDIGVLGRSVSGDYSTTHRFVACRWGTIVTAPVKNAGEAWTFIGPVVQQLVSGAAGFIARDATFVANGLTIIGIWAGDTTVTSGTWIDWHGNGLTIQGGTVGRCDKFVDANDAGPRGICAHGINLSGVASTITTGFRINGGRGHNITVAFHDTAVVTPISLTTVPVASFIMGRGGLAAPLDFEDITVIAAPAANTSKMGARLNGANQELNWKGDNNVLKTVATE